LPFATETARSGLSCSFLQRFNQDLRKPLLAAAVFAVIVSVVKLATMLPPLPKGLGLLFYHHQAQFQAISVSPLFRKTCQTRTNPQANPDICSTYRQLKPTPGELLGQPIIAKYVVAGTHRGANLAH